MRGVTWVVVEEKQSGDWGIGGQPLSTEAVEGNPRRRARLTRSHAETAGARHPTVHR